MLGGHGKYLLRTNKKGLIPMWNEPFLISSWYKPRGMELLRLSNGALLLDACGLTSELAQIVKLGATYLTALVHLDRVDVGRLQREDALYANGARHLADGETLLVAMTADLDDYATVELNTVLVTLDDFVSDSYGVTSTECRNLFAGCKCFLSNFN